MEFTITKEDIVIPDKCPLLGIDIIPKAKDRTHSPSLDRIDSQKGYIKGNVQIISNRANRIKSDATIEEIELLLNFMRRLK